jgi:pimeloyl-ACP methyl ester carboxylesterase
MEKLFIKNRDNRNVSVVVETPNNPVGLVFLMHGLGANKEKPHIIKAAKVFLDNNYTVVRFDTINSCGESDGNFEDATVTNYYADLEDVINWSKKQDFYQEPFVLAGSSLGGMCIVLYAEKYPEKVKSLIPIAPVISGELSIARSSKERIADWQKTGWQERPSESIPGLIKRLKWSHMEDRLKYDLLKKAEVLTMPVLLIVGELDESCPVEHQRILFESISSNNKELCIIDGAPHTFKNETHLQEFSEVVDGWIKKIN